jgi:hypothetical protein
MSNQTYVIHIKGHLTHDWADWLENMHMCLLENGEMVLCGVLADQAALMGILNKLNCLNLTIVSVQKADPKDVGQADCQKTENHSEI